MRYILANTQLSQAAGLRLEGHRRNDTFVIYNEKEISLSPALQEHDSLEKKAEIIGGKIYSRTELLQIINNNNMKL